MKTDKYIAWQRARDLTIEIYAHFGVSYDIDFENYICRSALSVCSQIAVSFDEQTPSKLIKNWYISRGCTSELEAMLDIAKKLKLIDSEKVKILKAKNKEITDIINQLIQANEK